MKNFIGDKLEVVIDYLTKKGFNFEIIDNNFSVDGDTKLVTNIVEVNDVFYITTGNFIFNIENKLDN